MVRVYIYSSKSQVKKQWWLWWYCIISCLWWWLHESTHAINYIHTYTNAFRTSEIKIRSVDCIDIIVLIVILYCSYVRCYRWEKLGEVLTKASSITSHNCMRLYNYLKFKSWNNSEYHKIHYFLFTYILDNWFLNTVKVNMWKLLWKLWKNSEPAIFPQIRKQ